MPGSASLTICSRSMLSRAGARRHDLGLFFGWSAAEDFFVAKEAAGFSWRALLAEQELADSLEKVDATSLRAAALCSDDLWDRLVSKTAKHS